MKINLSGAGKRFNREWIFRKADAEFQSGTPCAITGPNGSGKSTLLQCLAGMLQLSEGTIRFSENSREISYETAFAQISFCAPYFDVIEEMTLSEFLLFHSRFKTVLPGLTIDRMISITGLESAANKQIRNFSSGMKQRVKLAQAILFDTAVILLDEPCSNLDADGIRLYQELIQTYCTHRLVIVSSNDETEYRFCRKIISIQEFKQQPGLMLR